MESGHECRPDRPLGSNVNVTFTIEMKMVVETWARCSFAIIFFFCLYLFIYLFIYLLLQLQLQQLQFFF